MPSPGGRLRGSTLSKRLEDLLPVNGHDESLLHLCIEAVCKQAKVEGWPDFHGWPPMLIEQMLAYLLSENHGNQDDARDFLAHCSICEVNLSAEMTGTDTLIVDDSWLAAVGEQKEATVVQLPNCSATTDEGISSLGEMHDVGCLHLGTIARSVTSRALKTVVSGMKCLESLWLQSEGPTWDSTRLEGDFLQGVSALEQLRDLKITKIQGLGCNLDAYHKMKSWRCLRMLDVSDTDFNDDTLLAISGIDSLTELCMQGCEGVTDESRQAFEYLPNLRILNLAKTTISDLTVNCLSSLKQLKELNLGKTKVSNGCCEVLSQMTSLTNIDLSCKHITSDGLQKLRDCCNLTSLNLAFSKVTDEGIQQLRALPSLKCLSLRWTAITDSALEYIAGAPLTPKCAKPDLADPSLEIAVPQPPSDSLYALSADMEQLQPSPSGTIPTALRRSKSAATSSSSLGTLETSSPRRAGTELSRDPRRRDRHSGPLSRSGDWARELQRCRPAASGLCGLALVRTRPAPKQAAEAAGEVPPPMPPAARTTAPATTEMGFGRSASAPEDRKPPPPPPIHSRSPPQSTPRSTAARRAAGLPPTPPKSPPEGAKDAPDSPPVEDLLHKDGLLVHDMPGSRLASFTEERAVLDTKLQQGRITIDEHSHFLRNLAALAETDPDNLNSLVGGSSAGSSFNYDSKPAVHDADSAYSTTTLHDEGLSSASILGYPDAQEEEQEEEEEEKEKPRKLSLFEQAVRATGGSMDRMPTPVFSSMEASACHFGGFLDGEEIADSHPGLCFDQDLPLVYRSVDMGVDMDHILDASCSSMLNDPEPTMYRGGFLGGLAVAPSDEERVYRSCDMFADMELEVTQCSSSHASSRSPSPEGSPERVMSPEQCEVLGGMDVLGGLEDFPREQRISNWKSQSCNDINVLMQSQAVDAKPSGSAPGRFEGGPLSQIESLDLSVTELFGWGLQFLSELPNLKSLNLFSTKVSDEGLLHIASQHALVELNLCGTNITDRGAQHLLGLESLQVLKVSGNKGITDVGAKLLFRSLEALRTLEMRQTSVSVGCSHHIREALSARARLHDLEH